MKRHIFGGICQVLFRKKWGDFNYEQRKSLEKSRLRIPRRYYGNGEDGLVMGDVIMDDAGVPLLTIDARDGSVIQRIQAGWAASMGSKDIK